MNRASDCPATVKCCKRLERLPTQAEVDATQRAPTGIPDLPGSEPWTGSASRLRPAQRCGDRTRRVETPGAPSAAAGRSDRRSARSNAIGPRRAALLPTAAHGGEVCPRASVGTKGEE